MNRAYGILLIVALTLATESCAVKTDQKTPSSNPLNTVNNFSYILNANDHSESIIRDIFSPYDVITVYLISPEQYEINLKTNPKLSELEKLVKKSGGIIRKIQRNHPYTIF
jgi:hypothetical protein